MNGPTGLWPHRLDLNQLARHKNIWCELIYPLGYRRQSLNRMPEEFTGDIAVATPHGGFFDLLKAVLAFYLNSKVLIGRERPYVHVCMYLLR